MKLTTAQEKILTEAKKRIDEARAYDTFEEYEYNTNHYWRGRYTFEEAKELIKEDDIECGNWGSKYYEEFKKGIVIITANTRTIAKLEELGLIEIIKEGGSFPDRIKIVNY